MTRKMLMAIAMLAFAGCSQREAQPANPNASLGPAQIPPSTPASVKPAKTYDGPFGLQQGISLEEAKGLIPDLSAQADASTPGWYSTSNVPTPHPAFEGYSLEFSQKSGLCAIVGIGKDIQTGSSGAELRAQFDDLAGALTERYGNGKKFDYYSGGGSGDSQYFMMYLNQRDQTLAETWEAAKGAKLPPTMSGITLQAHASRSDTGFVNVRYDFANLKDCTAEEKATTNKGL